MPKQITDLHLEEISAVDNPANQSAKITLAKRAEPKTEEDDMADDTQKMDDRMKARMKSYMDKGMSEDEAMKMAEKDMKKSADELLVEVDALSDAVAKAAAEKEAAEAEVAKMAAETVEKSEETFELEGQVIRKSDVSESVFTVLKKQAEDIAKMKADAEHETLKKRAVDLFGNLGGSEDARAKLLKFAEGDAEVMEVLKGANEVAKEIFVEHGDVVTDDGSEPLAQIEKMVSDYAAEHKVTKEQAFTEVTKAGEGRKLLIESRSK